MLLYKPAPVVCYKYPKKKKEENARILLQKMQYSNILNLRK